jgi:hypothetical protein
MNRYPNVSRAARNLVSRLRRRGTVLKWLALAGAAGFIAACGAIGISEPHQAQLADITIGPGAQVSAIAVGEARMLSAVGKLVSSRSIGAVTVGQNAVGLSAARATKTTVARLSTLLPSSVATRSASSTRPTSTANPLGFLTQLSAGPKDRLYRVGRAGRDSVFTSAAGHSQTIVRYGQPGRLDTLVTVDQDGRHVMDLHLSWQSVHGGSVVRGMELDEFFPDGTQMQIVATVGSYSVELPPISQARAAHASFSCPVSSSSGSSSSSGCDGGGGGDLCEELAMVVDSAEAAEAGAEWVMNNACSADPGSTECAADTTSYSYAVALTEAAINAYNVAGCQPQ